LEHEDFVSKR